MTFGSLFSGIGGLDLGLERAGMECRWQVEIEPYCRRVLAKHWPDVPRFGDIREVDGKGLERVDLICGGFPCQDVSLAGKGAGIEGERSGLWSEYARIIAERRPRWVLVENVPALRSRGLWKVLEDLSACGYDAEWDGVPACAVGARHRRDRLWIVAHPNGEGLEGRVFDSERAREWIAGARRDAKQRTWSTDAGVRRVAHGVPNRVDRIRAVGNAVVPQVAEFIGRLILDADARLSVPAE